MVCRKTQQCPNPNPDKGKHITSMCQSWGRVELDGNGYGGGQIGLRDKHKSAQTCTIDIAGAGPCCFTAADVADPKETFSSPKPPKRHCCHHHKGI